MDKIVCILTSGHKIEIFLTEKQYHELRQCIVYDKHYTNENILIDGKDVAFLQRIPDEDIDHT